MAYKVVTVDVDVDIDLDEFSDEALVEELEHRGYFDSKFKSPLTEEELGLLIAHIDIRELPLDWEWQRIRDKLMQAWVNKK